MLLTRTRLQKTWASAVLENRQRCLVAVIRERLREVLVILNSKGQVTIPAVLRAKYGMRAGDEVEVVEVSGMLQIVRVGGAGSRGQRLVRRLRNTATSHEVAGMSTDQVMGLLRGE
jgi:AbrB family looped-hinge helix DNA binding protein